VFDGDSLNSDVSEGLGVGDTDAPGDNEDVAD
jgi:hypothetical protein